MQPFKFATLAKLAKFAKCAQLRYLSLILLIWLGIFLITRSALLLGHLADANVGVFELARLYSIGLAYDLGFLLLAGLPLAVYLLLCPRRLWQQRWHRGALHALLAISLFGMLFTALAEWLFWDEFGVRFNFIAVDYLVYSEEVLNNILESYPIYPLLAALAALAVIGAVLLAKTTTAALQAPWLSGRGSALALAAFALLAGLSSLLLGQDFPRGMGGNTYQRELASNGPYQFFAAFRNNELDYPQFYASLPKAEAAAQLRSELREPNAEFIGSDPLDIRRLIDNPGQAQRYNVVLVTIESLSAKYLGSFGNTRGLSPNLDRLSQQSLFFSNFYATGTRTDRGLEAISLSIPPTPGRSIVKRIGRESGFASLGQQFQAQGYDSVFAYGGRGYFDNMNAFFSGNGYRVVDQSSVAEQDIHFKNAWGMSDEDLYSETLKLADADHAAGQPFFLQLMTTSNHRPYTYPDGRIDIPSGDGRDGAVKYTDYAIGRFIDQARARPWFKDTLFVIVADHCASAAGKTKLPLPGYRIPLIMYAPDMLAPGVFGKITSQLDIPPTLLDLLGARGDDHYFGDSIFENAGRRGRAFISNYQELGYFKDDLLTVLSPRQGAEAFRIDRDTYAATPAPLDPVLLKEAIAYYQTGSRAFNRNALREPYYMAPGATLKGSLPHPMSTP